MPKIGTQTLSQVSGSTAFTVEPEQTDPEKMTLCRLVILLLKWQRR